MLLKHRMTYRLIIDPELRDIDFTGAQIEVYQLLNSPIGWEKYGYTFVPVLDNENVLIQISTPLTIRNLGGDSELSCAELGGHKIHLNAYRWLYGSPASRLPLDLYRQYMITHEMGHIMGLKHVPNPGHGLAPIMIQQTLGIGNCTPNAELFL